MEATSTSTLPPALTNTIIESAHGNLHITSTNPSTPHSPPSPTIFLIHGNSSSARIFTYIFSSPLALTHRVLAFDLPGHGDSTNAPDPHKSYTQSGYAEAAIDIFQQMDVKDVIVLGWSLGGHIGIEILDKLSNPDHPASKLGIRMRGLMIVGTPPSLGVEEVKAGFTWNDEPSASKDQLTEAEIDGMADAACGSAFGGIPQPWMRANVLRADGRARKRMFEAYKGREGCDQRAVMGKDLGTLVAVVNGAQEQFVDLDYIDGVEFGRLWEGKCHRIPGYGHTPFYEGWETFRPFLERFVRDCEGE
jgi:pimeloyl-ACP methyl ester carboxylesterase